jgi:hypothetical protein
MMRTSLTLLTLFLLLTSTTAMATRLYKWTDDKGNVYYGQTKPTDYNAVEVNAPPPPPADSPDLNKPFAQQILGKDGDKPAGSGAASSDIDPATKASQCAKARNNLSNLQNNSRVRIKNPDGSVRLLTEEEKQAKFKESQKQIDYYCN